MVNPQATTIASSVESDGDILMDLFEREAERRGRLMEILNVTRRDARINGLLSQALKEGSTASELNRSRIMIITRTSRAKVRFNRASISFAMLSLSLTSVHLSTFWVQFLKSKGSGWQAPLTSPFGDINDFARITDSFLLLPAPDGFGKRGGFRGAVSVRGEGPRRCRGPSLAHPPGDDGQASR